ncbi:unnamed protein product [Leptidea sinapis]|uniref:SHSP domain-containing protein n=1 Tax=Leptidea sinapis TaxID=189913 RepID=A0A5E4QMH4_9NEOP|nr:unnamed protein product [Leptidea sinapis]
MILRPAMRVIVYPKLYSWISQTRGVRPTIKIAKDKFQVTLDVRNFTKEELRVKARSEYLIIEGKHERKTKDGFVVRKFVRKFKLPKGCDPNCVKSELSPDGHLKVTALRMGCGLNHPCETFVQISDYDPNKSDDPKNQGCKNNV